jgi:putative addiction module component (TIGR02574 family)
MAKPVIDISSLTLEERIELIEQLWDSLDAEQLELSDDQRTELDRRLDALEQRGPTGRSWPEVETSIRGRSDD